MTRLETYLLMYWDLCTGLGSNKLREFEFKTEQQPSWPSGRQASLGEVGGEDGAGPKRRIVRIVLKCNQRFTFTPS